MRWPPYKHLIFDCDSTLTAVEGIDVLAELAGKKGRIEALTQAAMNGERDLHDVYAERLATVRPTRRQIFALRQIYKRETVDDAIETIAALHHLDHDVYIISGGLAEPVIEFGIYLGLPRERIRAVDIEYNKLTAGWWESYTGESEHDRYLDFQQGALTVSDGKAKVIAELLGDHPGRSLLVGDGQSDLLASHAVDLFAGYGGVIERRKVRQTAPVYLQSRSLAPLIVLAAGPAALRELEGTVHGPLAHKAAKLIQQGAFTFQDEQLREKFDKAYQALHPRPD